MNDPEILDPIGTRPRPAAERLLVHVLYGMHTAAWLSLGTLAVIALIVNYIRRADERDTLFIAHHRYMIATFWWTLLWLLVTSPLYLLFLLPGALAQAIVGLWYLYRCLRGWLRFAHDAPPRGPVLN
jgi:uncharacterized membrane protein